MGRGSNGFLSALSADDYELLRAHLRTVDLPHEAVLVETGETLRRAYFPHRGVISLVVNTLQQANFIHYSRGHIQIINLDGLRQAACECYATVKAQYDRLLGP